MTRFGRAVLAAATALALAGAGPSASLYTAEVKAGLDAIRPAALESHLRFLADDTLEGRGAGTRGYDLAAHYVAAQFQRIGLEPAGEAGDWYQSVPLRRATLVPTLCGVTLIRGATRQELGLGRDFVMSADTYRKSSDVTADVVFVGYGVTAPELGYDDFAGVDARGKVVAVLSGAPPVFQTTLRAHYSNGRVKDANLAAHGALGVLTIRTPVDERRATWDRVARQTRSPTMRWLGSDGVPDGVAPAIQCSATLHRAVAEELFRGAERSLDEVFAAGEQGKLRGFRLPLKARLRRASRHESAPSPNVAGLLRGSDPAPAAEVVVLSAHLDHLGIGEPVLGDSIYNGAFDNATGVASLIEVAAALARGPRPRRSILFLAVTAEEKGLEGSSYFAQHPTIPIQRIVADLNLDMYVMVGPLRDLVAHGAEHSTLATVVNQAAARLGLKVVADRSPEDVIFVRSDQYSFVRRGVPALYVVGGSGEEGVAARQRWMQTRYHLPQDDLSQPLDLDSLARYARLHYLMATLVANQPARPAWNPGDFFGTKSPR
jgi:peptidase M28-like protein